MSRIYSFQNFINLPFFNSGSQPQEAVSPRCPQCNYVLDRPHALTCSRCGTAIPQAQGCNGCGKCRKR